MSLKIYVCEMSEEMPGTVGHDERQTDQILKIIILEAEDLHSNKKENIIKKSM